MAWIAVEKARFFGYHGFYREEAMLGNEFSVSVFAEVDLSEPGDQLQNTLNYELLYSYCVEVMKGERRELIETLAIDICKRVKGNHRDVLRVRVRVEKCNPPLGGPVDKTWTEFEM